MSIAVLIVRNIADEVRRALRAWPARRHHSMEAEVREILEAAIRPQGPAKLGSILADIGPRIRLTDNEFDIFIFERVRDRAPARPAAPCPPSPSVRP